MHHGEAQTLTLIERFMHAVDYTMLTDEDTIGSSRFPDRLYVKFLTMNLRSIVGGKSRLASALSAAIDFFENQIEQQANLESLSRETYTQILLQSVAEHISYKELPSILEPMTGETSSLEKRRGALVLASSTNNTSLITSLLDQGTSIPYESAFFSFPLIVATRHGNFKAMELILQKGSDPKQRTGRQHYTALISACKAGNSSLLPVLLDAQFGPGKQQLGFCSHDIIRATISSKQFHILDILMEKFGDHPDYLRQQVLFIAAGCGNLEIVQRMLSAGAGVYQTVGGYTCSRNPLEYASQNGRLNIVKHFLTKATFDSRKGSSKRFWNSLPLSCIFRRHDVTQFLLDQGADVNFFASIPNCARFRGTALVGAAGKNDCSIMQKLLNLGAGLKLHDQGGMALSQACYAGHVDAAVFLMKAGVDPT